MNSIPLIRSRSWPAIFQGVLCLISLNLPCCTPEVSEPVAGEWNKIFSITPPELMRYGRSYAVDTIYFRYDSPSGNSLDSSGDRPTAVFPRLQAGLLEFSRGQTPDGFQAEQRGVMYDTLTGFTEVSGSGLYENRQTSVHIPADSQRFRFTGQPGKGFLIQDRVADMEIVAAPLVVLRDLQLGLARFTLFSGPVEIRKRGESTRSAMMVFQRLYVPAANPFDENARRMWAARARLWLMIQNLEGSGDGGDLLFAREQNAVLNPLFAAAPGNGTGDSQHDFAFLTRPDTDNRQFGSRSFPARFQIASADSGPDFTGDFQLIAGADEPAPRCNFELSAVHSRELYSIARSQSRLAAVRGRLVCPRRTYRLQGLMRAWPE